MVEAGRVGFCATYTGVVCGSGGGGWNEQHCAGAEDSPVLSSRCMGMHGLEWLRGQVVHAV